MATGLNVAALLARTVALITRAQLLATDTSTECADGEIVPTVVELSNLRCWLASSPGPGAAPEQFVAAEAKLVEHLKRLDAVERLRRTGTPHARMES